MKRVLVTGAAGFIGSHLVEELMCNTDFFIVALVRTGTAGDLKRLYDSKYFDESRIKIVWHDLKSPIPDYTHERIGLVDYVVHMAANSHVDRSITFPLEFVYDNVLGSANLFEYLRKYQPQVEKIINFSTDEVFGPAPDDYDFKEEDRFRPSNPYSASKAGQTALGHAYWVTYKLPVINTFTMNVFGERQNPEKLIPKAMRCAIKGIPMPVHAKLGDSGEVLEVGQRHWLHARNASNAVVFLLRNGIVGEYYNVVGDDEYCNDDIVKLVNNALGIDTPLIEYVDYHKSRPGHDRRYALDGSKLRALGWIPPLDFKTSVKKMVEWTKAHPEWL